jgi:NAD(P)-dependent dehydrogenase (short-subunit alcohol dehydrogenase family)
MEKKPCEGQVVIITGAATGIGKATALRFAEAGAKIAALDINTAQNEATVKECQVLGAETLALHCNVSSPESVKAAFDAVIEQWGRIDVLVTSAGIYSGSPLPEVSLRQWQKTIDVNLTGVFLCNQAVAEQMMRQRFGSIINVSSMAGKTSWPASAEYSASKSGVIGLTRSVAMELAPYGVTVNAICPGNTRTEMVMGVAEEIGKRDGMTPEEWLQMRANDCPMKRIAEPWEIAGVILFLSSCDSRYLTGQAIEVDGGLILS